MHCHVFFLLLRPSHDHRTVKVDELVVQPLTRLQTRDIDVRDLFASNFGDDAAFTECFLDEFFVCWREFRRQFGIGRAEKVVDGSIS